MKRIYSSNNGIRLSFKAVEKKTAIHEAGHAVAIYLRNKYNNLPPVFFQIVMKTMEDNLQAADTFGHFDEKYLAKVEGGRLIHTLPSSFKQASKELSKTQKNAYQSAFEADIINLLVGPLAEAKYVAQCDNEPISPQLVPFNALHFYGGMSDLKIVNDYLDSFVRGAEQRKRKTNELFLTAFEFVSEHTNWRVINDLAEYILADEKTSIAYDEIVSLIESSICKIASRAHDRQLFCALQDTHQNQTVVGGLRRRA